MNYIKYKDKSLLVRYNHTAIKYILTKFELASIEDFLKFLPTNLIAREQFLKIGLQQGSKFLGEGKEYTDDEVIELLDNVDGILGKLIEIFNKDTYAVFNINEDSVKKLTDAEAKKKKE